LDLSGSPLGLAVEAFHPHGRFGAVIFGKPFLFLFRIRVPIFEVTVGQIVVVIGIRVGVGWTSSVNVFRLSFKKPV